jgi:hypothetical protein
MEGHAMASIHKEMMVDASVEEVWAAIRDVGGIHTRLARQFVVDTRLDGMMDQGCAAMRRTLEADNGDDERIN